MKLKKILSILLLLLAINLGIPVRVLDRDPFGLRSHNVIIQMIF